MKCVILDGQEIKDKKELHGRLAEALVFPEWYGGNLDALYDCLTDLYEDVEICLLREDLLEGRLGDYLTALKRVIRRAAEENGHVHFICSRPGLTNPENII